MIYSIGLVIEIKQSYLIKISLPYKKRINLYHVNFYIKRFIKIINKRSEIIIGDFVILKLYQGKYHLVTIC